MVRIRPRSYQVAKADFPLLVQIRANNLRVNRAVVSDIRLVEQGVLTAKTQPQIREDHDAGTLQYAIDAPPGSPMDITQTIEAFFDSQPAENARYDITITAAGGETEKTAIRVPTINPGVANLTFMVR